jgi:hypothetical protein
VKETKLLICCGWIWKRKKSEEPEEKIIFPEESIKVIKYKNSKAAIQITLKTDNGSKE